MNLILIAIALLLIGCDGPGPLGPNNSRPSIGNIPSKDLLYGEVAVIPIDVIDDDGGDTHTIEVSCKDRGIASSSVDGHSVTIIGVGEGKTKCEVYATDSSEEKNAKSKTEAFNVSVSPPIDLGPCVSTMTVRPGESCTYGGGRYTFGVLSNGSSCRQGERVVGILRLTMNVCVNYDIDQDDVLDTSFSAQKNSDNSWTIRRSR